MAGGGGEALLHLALTHSPPLYPHGPARPQLTLLPPLPPHPHPHPQGVRNSLAWRGVKVFWTNLVLNYMAMAFMVSTPLPSP